MSNESEFPTAPEVDHTPVDNDEILALARDFAEYRKEISELREELRKAAPAVPKVLAGDLESEEDRLKLRLEEIAKHDFYCPGCGALKKWIQECTGTGAAPHPPIEVVSTDELKGFPTGHTAAPSTAAV
jgi:hypothetical protein